MRELLGLRPGTASTGAFKGLFTAVLLLTVIGGPFAAGPARSQDDTGPLVVFVEGGRPLDTASITNMGPDGVSQLGGLFRDLGARVEYSNLQAPLPSEARVVVVVRPLRRFELRQIVYLWQHIKRGNHLLLAIDPEGYTVDEIRVRPGFGRSGLARLLEADFGLGSQETAVVEPWFTPASYGSFDSVYSAVLPWPENPITEPLVRYELPVWVWAARDIAVEAISFEGLASPLLVVETGFGETDLGLFEPTESTASQPLTFSAADDLPAPLIVGAQAESHKTGARLVVLGDSELLMNGFGLASRMETPRHLGNLIFAQRLVAWLLEVPEDEWPALPEGYTWIALDGEAADWLGMAPQDVADASGDAPDDLDVQQLSAFADDSYLYFRLDTNTPLPPGAQVQLSFPPASAGNSVISLTVDSTGGIATTSDEEEFVVEDAGLASGATLEVRVPRRVVPSNLRVSRACLSLAGTDEPVGRFDCVEGPFVVTEVPTRSAYQQALIGRPTVTVYTANAVNLRRGPGDDYPAGASVSNGRMFAALGRSESGQWIQVEDGRDAGWVASYLVIANTDLALLPVIEAPAG